MTTDNLLLKIEEKVLALLATIESLRQEIRRLHEEKAGILAEHGEHAAKLQNLISMLDVLEESDYASSEQEVSSSMEENAL
jgi:FtsZ-binding cell division protein ZapB